ANPEPALDSPSRSPAYHPIRPDMPRSMEEDPSVSSPIATTPSRDAAISMPSEPPLERILVIEDELAMRTVLQDALTRRGYRVLSAAEGNEGLQRALQEKPDLVLLDIMMPRLDGFAVCRELRRLGF